MELAHRFVVLLREGLESRNEGYKVFIGDSFGENVKIILREVSRIFYDIDIKFEFRFGLKLCKIFIDIQQNLANVSALFLLYKHLIARMPKNGQLSAFYLIKPTQYLSNINGKVGLLVFS